MACDGTYIFVHCTNNGLLRLNCVGQDAGMLTKHASTFYNNVEGRTVNNKISALTSSYNNK